MRTLQQPLFTPETEWVPPDRLPDLSSHSEIAIDTELHGLQIYRDDICLIQICDDNKNVCLIKPEPKKVPRNLSFPFKKCKNRVFCGLKTRRID